MKTIKFVFLLNCCACSLALFAQENYHADSPVFFESSLSVVTKSHGLTPQSFQLRLGCQDVVPKLNIYFNAELAQSKGKEEKGFGFHYSSNNLGGGISYRLLNSNKGLFLPFNTLNVHFTCGTTVGNALWKNTLYEAGLSLGCHKRFTPILGIGYRWMHSENDCLEHLHGLVFSMGVRF